MIPKIVHYCWFGGNEKPDKIKKCIETWHTYLPDYTFMEWNESNFDIHMSDYVEQAYENRKYAFVSDIARIQALKQYGGIYFDTDVEVYKSFNDLLDAHCIFGLEYDNWVATSFMACEPDHVALKLFESAYEGVHFINLDGSMNTTTNVQRLTALLKDKGFVRENRYQELEDGICIYPIEYFSPYDYANCIMERTENSYCAHLFFVTWMPRSEQLKKKAKKIFVKMLGKETLVKLRQKGRK